jgi:hypothetical protein
MTAGKPGSRWHRGKKDGREAVFRQARRALRAAGTRFWDADGGSMYLLANADRQDRLDGLPTTAITSIGYVARADAGAS